TLFLAVVGTLELVWLIDAERRPPAWLCLASVLAVLLANWPAHVVPGFSPEQAWTHIAGAFAAAVLAAFLAEMAAYRGPGQSLARVSLTIFIVAYVGLLPCFLLQMRWLTWQGEAPHGRGVAALALA